MALALLLACARLCWPLLDTQRVGRGTMRAMVRVRTEELLLGEWACLGVLAHHPAHGYDVSTRLAPSGEVGRVWALSRPLTYRAIDQLEQRGLVVPVSEEKGVAGGKRTILAPTKQGRAMLRRWLAAPVAHLRDVRGELLLKLVLCELLEVDSTPLLDSQRALFAPMVASLRHRPRRGESLDPVEVWRDESSRAVLRFLDRLRA